MRVVGLCSTWMEGRLALSAVRSLRAACDVVHVYDGPVGTLPSSGPSSDWKQITKRDPQVRVTEGGWASDAAKRTSMLEPTRRLDPPVWGVILDGDELLLHGELLPDIIEWGVEEAAQRDETCAAIPLRLVEADGSVSVLPARILRLDLVEAWLASSNQIQFTNGVIGAFPNQRLVMCGEADSSEFAFGLQARRPLAGEPHVLHRSALRDPSRAVQRQHLAEADAWGELVSAAGMQDVSDARPAEDGVRIWLPK